MAATCNIVEMHSVLKVWNLLRIVVSHLSFSETGPGARFYDQVNVDLTATHAYVIDRRQSAAVSIVPSTYGSVLERRRA